MINSPTSSSNLKLVARDSMNLDQLAELRNSEYAPLLESIPDHSMEEERELFNSVRAQLSELQREIDTQLYTLSVSRGSFGRQC
jgi:hypothetical protein